jgi:hypothetical protein
LVFLGALAQPVASSNTRARLCFVCNEVVPAPQGQLAAPGVDFLKARFPDVGTVSFAYPVVPLKGIRSIRKQALTAQPATKRALASLPFDRGELVARAGCAEMAMRE